MTEIESAAHIRATLDSGDTHPRSRGKEANASSALLAKTKDESQDSGVDQDHCPCSCEDAEANNKTAESCEPCIYTSSTLVVFSHSGVAALSAQQSEAMGHHVEKESLLGAHAKFNYDSVEFAAARKSLVQSYTTKQEKRQKYLTMFLVVLVILFGAMCYSIQAPFYPAKAEQKGITPSQYGFVFGCFQLIICITAPIYGKYIMAIGPVFLFIAGIFLTGSCTILFGLLEYSPHGSTFFGLSLAIRIIAAFGESGVYTASYTIVPYTFPEAVATAVSMVETAFGLGGIIGPALGGVLFEVGGFPLPFAITGGILLIGGIATMFSLPKLKLEESTKGDRPSALKILKIPGVILMTFTIVSSSLTTGFVVALLEPHLREFKLTATLLGLVFVTNGLVYAVTASFCGRIIDKVGHYRIIAGVSVMINCIAFALIGPVPFLPLKKSLPKIIAALVLQGMGSGGTLVAAYMGTVNDLTLHNFPNDLHTHGLASGLFNCAYSVGAFIGPTVSGTLYENFGFAYASLAVFCLLSTVGLLIFIFEGFHTIVTRISRKSKDYVKL